MKPSPIVLVILMGLALSFGAQAAETLKTPHQIIGQLRLRITAIGQTTKTLDDYDIATRAAVNDLQTFIEKGANLNALTQKDKWGKTPLSLAAYMGFSEIVATLLAQPSVAISLNEPDDNAITPWTYSVFAARQSAFACNPKIFTSPFSWAPMHQSQAYYTARNPYPTVRKLLEDAGAIQDMDKAKQQWNAICTFQPADVRAPNSKPRPTYNPPPSKPDGGRWKRFWKKIQKR